MVLRDMVYYNILWSIMQYWHLSDGICSVLNCNYDLVWFDFFV